MRLTERLLRPSAHQARDNALWNMIGSVLFALSSVVLFALVNRMLGHTEAGFFSITLTTCQLLAAFGYYEVRSFHVTDVSRASSFSEYFSARAVSCTIALLAGVIAALLERNADRRAFVLLLCVYKLIDAFADVFESEFQRCGRLDLTGKSLASRTLLSVAVFTAVLAVSRSLSIAAAAAVAVSLVHVAVIDISLIRRFASLSPAGSLPGAGRILWACLPLCIGGFLSMYICNASKYAVDAVMNEQTVSLYTALYMPTSAINLLSGFIFRPHLTDMGRMWADRDDRGLKKLTDRLLLAVAGLTVFCVVCAAVAGIPVLQIVFSIGLTGMRLPLVILIAGGGMNAASILLYYVLTAMRCQRLILICYAVTAAAVLLLAAPIVRAMGLVGASLTYAGFLTVQTALLYITMLAVIRGRKNPTA